MLKVILRIFLYLLDKHFGGNHKYHKIFNRNNAKISYNCIDNIKNIVNSHRKNIIYFYNNNNNKKLKPIFVGIKAIVH